MKQVKIKRGKNGKYALPTGGYSFIVGNGTSRKDLPLKSLMGYGTLYACNWFFRDEFTPHVLVASDEPMTKCILKDFPNFAKRNWFYTWFPKPGSGAKKAPCPEKFAAGIMASHIAAHNYQSDKIFLIGMDFFGFGSENTDRNGKLNNLYAGKQNYASDKEGIEHTAPTYRNWQRRFQWILQNYPDVEFWHVNPFEGKSPERLRGFDNFHQCTWENLQEHLNSDSMLIDILEKTEEDIELAYASNPDNTRACLERQIVGQENILYADILPPRQVLELRLKAAEQKLKDPRANPAVTLNVDGIDHVIPLYAPLIRVKEGLRVCTPEEILYSYKKEIEERNKMVVESPWVDRSPETARLPEIKSPEPNKLIPPKAPLSLRR